VRALNREIEPYRLGSNAAGHGENAAGARKTAWRAVTKIELLGILPPQWGKLSALKTQLCPQS